MYYLSSVLVDVLYSSLLAFTVNLVQIKNLPHSHSVLFQMTPSHVLLKQCTGGCTLLEPSCLPSKTSTKKIPVLVAKCGINQGNYRN